MTITLTIEGGTVEPLAYTLTVPGLLYKHKPDSSLVAHLLLAEGRESLTGKERIQQHRGLRVWPNKGEDFLIKR